MDSAALVASRTRHAAQAVERGEARERVVEIERSVPVMNVPFKPIHLLMTSPGLAPVGAASPKASKGSALQTEHDLEGVKEGDEAASFVVANCSAHGVSRPEAVRSLNEVGAVEAPAHNDSAGRDKKSFVAPEESFLPPDSTAMFTEAMPRIERAAQAFGQRKQKHLPSPIPPDKNEPVAPKLEQQNSR